MIVPAIIGIPARTSVYTSEIYQAFTDFPPDYGRGSALADGLLALSIYTAMSADKGLEQAYRDLALVRATALEFDALKPDQVISRLQPLAQTGQPFFGSAGEMTALAMLAKGQKTQAGQLFAKLAADKDVPETIRSRAVQIASSLGVDASAALPAVATAQ